MHSGAEVQLEPMVPVSEVPASMTSEQLPKLHVEFLGQAKQVEPPEPQAAVEVPGVHCPVVASQQPGQFAGEQPVAMQRPLWHVAFGGHELQTFPPRPQTAALCDDNGTH